MCRNGANQKRFRETTIAQPDNLVFKEVEVLKIVLGEDGKPLPPKSPAEKEKIRKYSWQSLGVEKLSDISLASAVADGDDDDDDDEDKAKAKVSTPAINVAWKWSYVNPEEEHRTSPYATGLTINVRLHSC